MSDSSDKDRLHNLYEMLIAMAHGDTGMRIAASGYADDLDVLAAELNKLAAELQAAIAKSGYVLPYYRYENVVQATFALDLELRVIGLSSNVSTILGYDAEGLAGGAFIDLLAPQCQNSWEMILSEVGAAPLTPFHKATQLLFITADRQYFPCFCIVSKLLFTDILFVSTVTTVLVDSLHDRLGIPEAVTPKVSDAGLIQRVHDYILQHLEEPLPSTHRIAKMFGTNDVRIKVGFRHFFNTSIYQFYTEERLKKAHLLITHSDIALKAVAIMSGFNDYVNFYKAFKKRYGYAPSELVRRPEK